MAFCDNLQYLRKMGKITQEELAEKLGVSRQSVSKWETGDAYPETEKIIALCRMFGVSMDELMLGDLSVCGDKAAGASCENISSQTEDGSNQTSEDNEPEEQTSEKKQEDDILFVTREEAEKIENFSDLPEKVRKVAKWKLVRHAINSALFACAMISFFCLGAISNLWNPAWLLFPLCISLCAFADKLFSCKKDGTFAPLGKRILKALSSSVWLLAVTAYLFIGIVYSLWHPGWVIFIACVFISPLLETLIGLIYIKKDKS